MAPSCRFLGATLDAKGVDSWFGSAFSWWSPAWLMFELARRQFGHEWGRTQEEIDKEIKRREAARDHGQCDGWLTLQLH